MGPASTLAYHLRRLPGVLAGGVFTIALTVPLPSSPNYSFSVPAVEGLRHGLDSELSVVHLRQLSATEPKLCTVMEIMLAGGVFTADRMARWGQVATNACPWCQMPDTEWHRWWACPQHDMLRTACGVPLEIIPEVTQLTGVVPMHSNLTALQ
eukprot:4651491-Amphidinium_carterae.1